MSEQTLDPAMRGMDPHEMLRYLAGKAGISIDSGLIAKAESLLAEHVADGLTASWKRYVAVVEKISAFVQRALSESAPNRQHANKETQSDQTNNNDIGRAQAALHNLSEEKRKEGRRGAFNGFTRQQLIERFESELKATLRALNDDSWNDNQLRKLGAVLADAALIGQLEREQAAFEPN